MDLPIAVDVCCAPIVVPDDASVPDAPASEPSEAAQAAPVEAEAVPEAAPEAAPAVVKPPCGEELWNCVKDALAAEAWESKDPKVPRWLSLIGTTPSFPPRLWWRPSALRLHPEPPLPPVLLRRS